MLTAVQVLVETTREQILLIQNELFAEVLTISADIVVFRIRKDIKKTHVAVDLEKQHTKHTSRKCFRYVYVDNRIDKCPKPPKDNKNNEILSVSMKGLIVYCNLFSRIVIMIRTKTYMHPWHECLVMEKFLVHISVTVCNGPIGF